MTMTDQTTLLPTDNERLAAIEARLDRGSIRMDLSDEVMRENTAITQEVRDILAAAKTGLRVLGGLGTLFKWVGMVAGGLLALYTAIYALMHGGATPK